MYKRYVTDAKSAGLGGTVNFFLFCVVVVWLLPFGVEAVSGHPVELYMMPPSWRAEILCTPPGAVDADRSYKYAYDGGCARVCKIPGCGEDGPAPTNGEEAWRANVAEARQGLNLYDVFELFLLGLRYGTLLVALAGLGVMGMGRPAWFWLCIPCGVAAVAALHPVLWIAAVPAWAAAYATDMRSTARFGEENVRRHEVNPVLRRLMKYGMRRAFAMHTALYVCLLACVPYATGLVGPLPWHATTGMLMFGLAAVHLWVAACNTREYRTEAERR